ncbi:DUF3500 domain-containing protein [Streptomyces sp. GbtcB6]|uniref:DUF3500 domain-containing protein n=1 Tax=Streptomyces sp. GbtcB6 TaxID=2824751 RepID=UPI0020C72BDD|nr:DUF3500 domain-containing protein [Streptomyces sp. GbtcB6]
MSETKTHRRLKSKWKRAGVAFAAGTALLLGGIYVNANAATTPSDSSAGDTSADATTATTEASSSVSDVVDAANAFLDTLDTDQQSDVLLDFTEANATAWSNLPCGSTCRVGIEFSTLSDEQLTAAKAVVEAATGTGSGTGYDQITQILAADDKLGETASGYGSGNYYLAFLGTPSTDGTWQLHFGGHHLALNLTYKDGEVEGTTPFFIGVEPTSWTGDDGTSYAPLAGMHDGMEDMLAGLSDDELSEAKLSESFSDVLLGPGSDGDFPETREGLKVSELTDDQQELVLAAIEPWVDVADDTTAASVLSAYQADLDDTYIAYSGSSDLSAQGDYVRIDGPGVWIELACQNGVVYQNQIHYHTVYRDHDSDYGGEFSF